MSTLPEFAVLEVPARIANLSFRMGAPQAWTLHALPGEDVDFSEPGTFFPLVVLTAPGEAVALTVAARPGFENGTLQDWSLFLLDSQGIRPTAFGPAAIGNVQGLAGVGRQQQEETWLEIRFAFFEDGGRLVHLGLLAPEGAGEGLEAVWAKVMESFDLAEPQGPTVPVGPGMGISPEPVVAAPAAGEAAEAPRFTDCDLGFYAKADDLGTLDPEHPTNAGLRDRGIGLVPNVLAYDLEAKTAKIGAGAIRAVIRVALGWHVIDDGKRTLLLDPDGKVQISLGLLEREGRSEDLLLDALQEEAERSYENPQFGRMEHEGIWGLAVHNIAVNGEPIVQMHLLTAWADETAMLRARVTSDLGSMRFAADYADVILRSAEYGLAEEPEETAEAEAESEGEVAERTPTEQLPWRERYRQLELEDRLEEAEALLRKEIPNLFCAIQIAHMYRDRWIRLQESDGEKAAEARRRAAEWANIYASSATSGGEGVALSRERKEFLASLGPEPY